MKKQNLNLCLVSFLLSALPALAVPLEVERSTDIPVEEVTLTLTAQKITLLDSTTPQTGIPSIAVIHQPRIALSKPVNLDGKDVSQIRLSDGWETRGYVCKAMGFKDVYYLWGFSNYDEHEGFYYVVPEKGTKLALHRTSSRTHRQIDRITCLR